jgi:hypothetical protein
MASEPPCVAPRDEDETTTINAVIARALLAKPDEQHLDIVLKLLLIAAQARLSDP